VDQVVRYRSRMSDSGRWKGFEFRDGDVVISTPSKCGTTWMQNLVSMLLLGDEPLHRPMAEVSPWMDMLLDTKEHVHGLLAAQQHRRFIKTHTPLDGLPFDERVHYVFVGRDPRDQWLSWEHHFDNMDMERLVEHYVRVLQNDPEAAALVAEVAGDSPEPPPSPTRHEDPIVRFRTYVDEISDDGSVSANLGHLVHHTRTFWDRAHLPNVTMFHYGDMLADLPGQIRRLADALGVEVDDETVARLAARGTFASMKERAEVLAPNTNHQAWKDTSAFFHRGTSGQWTELLGPDDVAHFHKRLRERAGSDELAAWIERGTLG